MTAQIDLIKKVELILTKKGFADNIVARVGIALDESGSMAHMFANGYVSKTVDRALSVGYKFDDNGEIDVWSFSSSVKAREPAQQSDFGSYVKHRMLGGSTLYHPVLADIGKHYFGQPVKSSFFGFRKTVQEIDNTPVFVAFITDGMPDNENVALDEVSAILKKYPKMFVQFIGIGSGRYAVLKKLASENDNAAFATIEEGDSDETVLEAFLNSKARKVLEA